MASALLPYVVLRPSKDAWQLSADGESIEPAGIEVAHRETGEVSSTHDTVREALDAALVANGITVSGGVLRDEDGAKIGAFRWLDGTAEELEAADDGSQVTRDLIARMAAKIDPASPVPMDGAEHGTAHSQLYDTSTRADGYVHAGIEGRDGAGRWHLYIYSELSPKAARDVDLGLLAYGSIGFDQSAGRLLQHALTNVPAVEGLAPNNAIRNAGRVSFRTRRIDMTTPPKTPNASKRGAALDLLMSVAEKLGIAAPADESPEEIARFSEAMLARIEPAEVEPEAPVEMSADTSAARALPGFADDAAQETWTSEVLGILRDVFGQAEGEPASVLDMLKSSSAAFKGSIGAAPDPAAADAQAVADAAALTSKAEPAMRALTSKVDALTGEIARRDVRDDIVARFRSADVSMPSAEDLATLVTDALKLDSAARSRFVDMAVASKVPPPKGDVFGKRSAPPTTADLASLIEAELPALREKHKGEPAHVLYARARKVVVAKFPALS